MKKNDSIDIASREVGGVPLIRQFFDRLDLERLIERYVPEKKLGRKPVLPAAKVLSVLVANTILSREPLYALSEWLERFVLEPFGLSERAAKLFNDDRVGRALDRLYSVDPASLLTAIVTKAIREFKIDLDQIHNDTTSVMFSGAYDGQTNAAEKAHPPTITFGHSKDHRPDLKQLVYSLTISSDGAVPIHFKTYDGNMTDDQTHIETWSTICKIKRNADFTYVADSKLCTRENMSFIHSRGGRFVTVLPRSRKEDDDFRDFLKTNSVNWKEIFRKQSRRGKKHVDIYKAYEPDERSSEGHRLIWFHSSIKEELDQRRRARRIKRARQRLRELEGRTGAHRFRSKETAETAAAAVLQEEGAERWIKVTVEEQLIGDVKQLSPGRPGKNTVYRKIDIPVILFDIIDRGDAIQEDARCDGIFGMITNLEEESDFEVFRIYKYQPFLEKRNEQLKTVLGVAPVFLKKPERVAALLFVYFIAILVFALIERELRDRMKDDGIAALALYPERRNCKSPTTDVILRALDGMRRTQVLDDDGEVLKTFHDELRPAIRQALRLLRTDLSAYGITRSE